MSAQRSVLRNILASLLLLVSIQAQALSVTYDNSIMVLSGSIMDGDGARFRRALHDIPSTVHTAVIMDVPGGSVAHAIDIGLAIRDRGLSVFIAGTCVSACPVMAAGGTDVTVGTEGKVGVHWIAWNSDVKRDDTSVAYGVQQNLRAIWNYTEDMGMKAEAFMYLLINAKTESAMDLYWLSKAEIRNIGWQPSDW